MSNYIYYKTSFSESKLASHVRKEASVTYTKGRTHSALPWGNEELAHHSIPVTNHLAHGGGSCLPSHRLSSIIECSNTNWKGSWMPSWIIPVYSPLLYFSYHLVLEAISASISLVNWASVGKLILKIDFFFFFLPQCIYLPFLVATAHQASKSKIQCICRCEAVQ